MSETIPSGTLLGGKYRVGALLGQGGMGAVYEGMQEGLDRRVALKVLHAHLSGEKELLGRFQREARAVATLGHPNVVQISDFQVNPGEPPFLVMELLQGESLRELLKRTGPLPPERAAYIFSQVLAALEAAHAKDIVHRDIKPDNIFLSSTSVQADLVKVLDFGVAKVLRDGDKDGKLTQSGFVVGTLSYMAPEQAMGDELDGRADLYSVGACMYLALTGRKPFDAPTTPALLKAILTEKPVPLAALRQDIDLSLAALVDRALQRDPKNRFANAHEMATALAPFARSTPHEDSSSEIATQPREAVPPATDGRQPVPTAMTAQLGPGATAPVAPAVAFSQRATALPAEAAAASAPPSAVEAPAVTAAPALGPRGPKGTLVSPARAMPPRPATAPVFAPPPTSVRPELLAAATASPPSFTPAPHAMESPPMVASTTAPLAAGGTAVMATAPEPAPSPVATLAPVAAASPPPPQIMSPAPSTTQPAATAWTPPPATAAPMAAASHFVPHAPAPQKRSSSTTILWIGVALVSTITVVALVAGSLVLRQMMAAASPAPAAAASSEAAPDETTSAEATTSAPADSTAAAAPLPAASTSASTAHVPTAITAKPKGTTTATATHAPTTNSALDLSGNRAAIGTVTPTPTPTATATTTTTATTTATATATPPPGSGSHKKGPK